MEEKLKNEIKELLKELSFQDSIEIGNSKTGVVKVYVDFENKEQASKKLETAISLLKEKRKEVLNGETEVTK